MQVIDLVERRKVRDNQVDGSFGARGPSRQKLLIVPAFERDAARVDEVRQCEEKNSHIFGSTSYAPIVKPRSAKNRASIPGPAPKSNSEAPGGAILRTRS